MELEGQKVGVVVWKPGAFIRKADLIILAVKPGFWQVGR